MMKLWIVNVVDMLQINKRWFKKVQQEWNILQKNLPGMANYYALAAKLLYILQYN